MLKSAIYNFNFFPSVFPDIIQLQDWLQVTPHGNTVTEQPRGTLPSFEFPQS